MKRLVLFVTLLAAVAAARVIVVPDSAGTIQAGLAMAGYGDTVLVMPDRYDENITWPSTDGIKLYSAAGPDSTIIDGGGNGRPLYVGSASRATEIRGFTITGGKLTTGAGAGIYVSGSPVIAENVILNNERHGTTNHGGGIYCASGSSPLITANRITGNIVSDTNTWNYGGGIHIAGGSAEVCFNVIDSNRAAEGYWNYGAGIYVGSSARPLIWQNVIRGNVNTLGDRGHGAGIYAGGPSLVFANLIIGNTCSSGSWNYGAGVKVNAPTEIYANTFTGNACQGGNWSSGGAVFADIYETTWVRNNVIAANSASSGGGIYCYQPGGTAYSSHNNVWNNAGGNYVNCTPGTGDISQDPLFVAGPQGAYCLSQVAAGQAANSPCLDAGDTIVTAWPVNLDSMLLAWTTRTDSVMDATPIDIGYHYPAAVMLGVAERPAFTCRPVRVAPNPSRGPVRFSLPASRGPLRLVICDAAGRVVRTLAGAGTFEWDGRDAGGREAPAGVYPWRIEGPDFVASGRLARL